MGVRQPVPDGKRMSVTMWGGWPVTASWNWPGMEGKPLDVEVYSRGESVRLFLADKLIGEKPTTRAEKFTATFSVPYAPGVLTATAMSGGKPLATATLRTVGDAQAIRLTADRTALRADGHDLSFITVEAIDRGGLPHPNAAQEVTFTLKGPGAIAAVGNGDLTSEEPYRGDKRKLFQGKALVVVRTARSAGALTLTASSPGLKPAAVTM